MRTEIYMPQLGLTMSQGKLLRWLKSAGETVVKDEPLVEIETDKAIAEIEAPASGILESVQYVDGDTVDIGVIIGYVLQSETDGGSAIAAPSNAPAAVSERSDAPNAPRVPGGAINLTAFVDASRLLDLSARLCAAQQPPVTAELCLDALLLKVVAAVLLQNPEMNGASGCLTETRVRLLRSDGPGPTRATVSNAERKGIGQISQELLARSDNEYWIAPDSAESPSCILVIASAGSGRMLPLTGSDLPESAVIVGVQRTEAATAPAGRELLPGPMMWLTLRVDSPLIQSPDAARFLQVISEFIEQPLLLLA